MFQKITNDIWCQWHLCNIPPCQEHTSRLVCTLHWWVITDERITKIQNANSWWFFERGFREAKWAFPTPVAQSHYMIVGCSPYVHVQYNSPMTPKIFISQYLIKTLVHLIKNTPNSYATCQMGHLFRLPLLPISNFGQNFTLWKSVYDSLSDVPESRVEKNLTPCRMHWNAFLIGQIIAKCHSFPNMYDML